MRRAVNGFSVFLRPARIARLLSAEMNSLTN
jgi:hypothetical protein